MHSRQLYIKFFSFTWIQPIKLFRKKSILSWFIKVSHNLSINNILIFGRCEEWRCDDWSLLMFPISWKWQKEAKSLGVRLKQNLINVARSTDRHTALNLYSDKNIVIMINKWAGDVKEEALIEMKIVEQKMIRFDN